MKPFQNEYTKGNYIQNQRQAFTSGRVLNNASKTPVRDMPPENLYGQKIVPFVNNNNYQLMNAWTNQGDGHSNYYPFYPPPINYPNDAVFQGGVYPPNAYNGNQFPFQFADNFSGSFQETPRMLLPQISPINQMNANPFPFNPNTSNNPYFMNGNIPYNQVPYAAGDQMHSKVFSNNGKGLPKNTEIRKVNFKERKLQKVTQELGGLGFDPKNPDYLEASNKRERSHGYSERVRQKLYDNMSNEIYY